jgi:hypothetical protein
MVVFVKAAGRSARHDPWCIIVTDYLSTNTPPPDFVGSCCELRLQKETTRGQPKNDSPETEEKPTKTAKRRPKYGQGSRAKRAKLRKRKQLQLQHETEPQAKLEMKRKQVKKTMEQKKRYDGSIHFPEFDLLVDAPFECVDIHGLGDCGEKVGLVGGKIQWKIHFHPVAHCVVSQAAADSYERTNTKASGNGGDYSTEIHRISIESVHDPSEIFNVSITKGVFLSSRVVCSSLCTLSHAKFDCAVKC